MVIIVIIGILAAVAILKCLDLVQEASKGAARGVRGVFRSANALRFGKNILGNTTAPCPFDAIAVDIVELKGFTVVAADITFVMTAGTYVYAFSLTPTPRHDHPPFLPRRMIYLSFSERFKSTFHGSSYLRAHLYVEWLSPFCPLRPA